MTESPPLVFVHVPKTAGMSLHYAIERHFDRESVVRVGNADDHERFMQLSVEQLADIAYLSGHLPIAHLLPRFGRSGRYVTVLRDPVERILSAFHYINSTNDHPLHGDVSRGTFADYLRGYQKDLRSIMCRQLADTSDADHAVEFIREKYTLVGVTNRLEAFTIALSTLMGFPLTVYRSNETSSFGKIMFNSDDLHLLRELTAEDHKLVEAFSHSREGVFVRGP